MLDFFEKIPFDDIDGGVWKQGWDIRCSEDAFDKKKLLVFVMPHSHNDPGKVITFYPSRFRMSVRFIAMSENTISPEQFLAKVT